MKKKNIIIWLIIMLCLAEGKIFAQQQFFETQLIKVNLLPLAIRSYNVSYETAMTNQWSLSLSANVRPENGFPYQNTIEDYYTDQNISVSNTSISQFSITPEARYYFLSSTALRGFYISGFLQYSNFGLTTQIDYKRGVNEAEASVFALDGNIHTYTMGVAIGHQWRLSDSFYLDWMFVGPSLGVNRGSFFGANTNNRPLEDYEQQILENKPNEFNIPLFSLDVNASSNELEVRTRKMWAGARLGLSIGYRF